MVERKISQRWGGITSQVDLWLHKKLDHFHILKCGVLCTHCGSPWKKERGERRNKAEGGALDSALINVDCEARRRRRRRTLRPGGRKTLGLHQMEQGLEAKVKVSSGCYWICGCLKDSSLPWRHPLGLLKIKSNRKSSLRMKSLHLNAKIVIWLH